ncbi:MAG: site-specific DNA-methyltransferase [Leptospiraceae bacterium]|nr:site-specific DNA-methyltransferase [Leptospiraceae bacterium]MCP5494398.1 site-specific DNA-methyltransferase [Leptospiraceae bacterium]
MNFEKYINTIIHADSIKKLKSFPNDSIHLILSDIPYGIGVDEWDVLHKNTNSAYLGTSPAQEKAGALFKKRGKPLNGWSEADRLIPLQYYEWCLQWTNDWYRILKPGGSAIVFAGRRLAHRCISAFEDAGFTYKDMIAWYKEKAPHRAQRISVVYEKRGDDINAKKWDGWRVGNLRPIFEPILWFTKPYKLGGTIADNMLYHELGAYNETGFLKYTDSPDNCISISSSKNDIGLHPTQKPLNLMNALIELTTLENQIVLDPFCGSGSTIISAFCLKRRFIGIELELNYYKNALKRLNSLQEKFANSPCTP